MIWLVRVALARPYTFIVLALAILIIGPLAALTMPTDIFPAIRVPVIGVAWSFTGLSPDQISARIITPYERVLTTTVDNVEHTESQSLPGIGIVKIYFQPDADIRTATAQVTSISQTLLRSLPAGTTPPLILNYDASTVPVIQVTTSSTSLPEQKILDLTQNFMRPALTTIPGTAIPYSYGGKVRQIQIDLDPQALQAKGLSAQDVGVALANQNQILPAGTVKIGSMQYNVNLNDAAPTIADLNDLPVKTVDGTVIYIHDIGNVRDGSPPQQSIVHVDGRRAVLTSILKTGSGSTLAVVNGVKAALPGIAEGMPPGFKIALINDQSLFVTAAISGVIREGLIAAALTSLMILLFLGSWRSTLIIATSIPLAILSSVAGLWVIGQTLNIMTLGGLALAVGILVDDGTVTIENINYHLEQGKDVNTAIMDGAAQIVKPAFVSMLCICIVFIPMFALQGVAGYLFKPLAEAVVFAMVASFLLSRTLVPTLAMYLLKPHDAAQAERRVSRNPLVRFQQGFENRFARFREGYRNLLAMALARRGIFIAGFLLIAFCSFALYPFLGSNFFPSVDSGQIELHVRPPVGTRIEDASAMFGEIEKTIRQIIRAGDLATIVDNIGLPTSSINTIYSNDGIVGYQDGDIFISLKAGHRPTAGYVRELRRRLAYAFPGATFSFLPADIVSQILNFGSPAPIDVQMVGQNAKADKAYAIALLRRLRSVPGIADARIQQSSDNPQLNVDVDRSRIAQLGLNELNVTQGLDTSLAGTAQTAPTFWVDPVTSVSYPIVAQVPEYRIDSLSDLENIPVTSGPAGSGGLQVLGGLAKISRAQTDAVVSHYNIKPVIDIFATAQDRDLGGVAKDVQRDIDATTTLLPKGAKVVLRGQVVTMNKAFSNLFLGLLAAIVLIYLLIVVNFQSWMDPFVIITALPAALAGILWMLFATHTTLSVPALTGAIMGMGVATANSILVVAFARERLASGVSAAVAAIEAAETRLRPVLMTALAMIIGMTPMALGLGEGGEQNAPLGRAVIGGLIFATVATLMFVPVVFSIMHGGESNRQKEPRMVETDREQPDPLRYTRPKRLRLAAIIVAVIAVVILLWGTVSRLTASHQLAAANNAASVPAVTIISPKSNGEPRALVLPANIKAFYQAPIYAQVSGYLKTWTTDIGTKVRTGEVMAEISTPDLDQQLLQAQADLVSARANQSLSASTARRWNELLAKDAVSQQDADDKNGDLAVKSAAVDAARAAVDRLQAMEGFKHILAPFDGVVTARGVDVGALVSIGSPGQTPLFTVDDETRLRIYVEVPQVYSAQVTTARNAVFTVPEYPGQSFDATLASNATAIDPATGSLLVQFQVNNAAGMLHPGDYAQMHIALPANAQAVTVPPSALMFRDAGMAVATLGAGNHVVLKQVTIGRDLGTVVEIADGLTHADRIIDNPPDSLQQGDLVRPVHPGSANAH